MKLSEERVLEIFSSLNFTQNETNVMLHIFKNYLQKERKIVLNNIASELNFTGEYIRRVLDSAIKKMISNPISEELFGSYTNPHIAFRKRKIIECISKGGYSSDFPDIYSFFSPFYTKEQVSCIIDSLPDEDKEVISYVDNWCRTKYPPNGFRFSKREVFFRIIEKVFDKLIELYGNSLVTLGEPEVFNPELNFISIKAFNRTPDASFDEIFSCCNYKSYISGNVIFTRSVSGLFDSPDSQKYPRWMLTDAMSRLNRYSMDILHKAYGSHLRWPVSSKNRGVSLNKEDNKDLEAIKRIIVRNLADITNISNQGSGLILKYDEYLEVLNCLIETMEADSELGSEKTRNNMIVFLFFGTDDSRPLSVGFISEYFGLPVSEVRLIILKYLENIKDKINALYERMMSSLKDDSSADQILMIQPGVVKRKYRRYC